MNTKLNGALAAMLIAGLLSACGSTPSDPVTIAQGDLQGINENGIVVFRNIPYAAPPIGDLRWRAPQPGPNWEGVRDASAFGPACWQDTSGGNADFMESLTQGAGMGGFTQWFLTTMTSFGSTEVAEDCLSINIMAPEGAERLPVMFWIHGGGHQFGSGGQLYESPSLVGQGIVLVSINYRLGLYGFLAHPELSAQDPNGSSGNYGMLDQIAALAWVRDNIAAFGGDPHNVTIFGESAGGHSVGQLLASPLAEGLFHRAIAQSGTGFYQFQATQAAYERISGHEAGREVARAAGVGGKDEIAALRKMSTQDLWEVAVDPVLSGTYHPQIDGYVLPRSTAQIFAEGTQLKVPLIVGSNADEGSVLYYLGLPPVDGGPPEQPETLKAWDDLLENQFGTAAPKIDATYQVDLDTDVPRAAEQLMGDTWFGRHAFYMAQSHSAAGYPTYLYFYERHPPTENQTIGASHALEISHVFGGFIPMWPTDDRDDQLGSEMQRFWTTFARTGNPNAEGLPAWGSFNDLEANEMAFGHERSYTRRVAREDRYRAMSAQFEKRVVSASIGGD